MPNISFVCIGSLKERWWQNAQAEYLARLSAFCRAAVVEKKEAALPKNASAALIGKALEQEAQALLAALSGTLIALSPEGERLDSAEFSSLVKSLSDKGDVSFAVGGSHGLHDSVRKKARCVVSFSAMTMPHQLFRIVLLEQVYRAFMIAAGRAYHK